MAKVLVTNDDGTASAEIIDAADPDAVSAAWWDVAHQTWDDDTGEAMEAAAEAGETYNVWHCLTCGKLGTDRGAFEDTIENAELHVDQTH
jgi:hypothetical protein